MKQPATRYRIDDLVIDVGARRVLRNGTVLGITGLTFDLLLALGQVAPALLSLRDIFDRVWPGQVVGNEALTQRIKLLRQQLGDDVRKPRYVASRRGYGYRLLSAMTPLPIIDVNPGAHREAHALYLQARTVARGTSESAEKACAMIDAALSLDPEHSQARAYRAFLLAGSVGLSGKPSVQLQLAEQDANHALSLDPELPDAHAALAILAAHDFQWNKAEIHFRHALELAPTVPFFRNLYVLSLLRPTGKLRGTEAEHVLTSFYAALAKKSAGRSARSELESFLPSLDDMTIDRRTRSFFITACIQQGGYDCVFRLLERYQQQPAASRPSLELGDLWLPELQDFRADMRFAALVEGFRLPNCQVA